MAQLLQRTSDGQEFSHKLRGSVTSVGRNPDNSIVLNDGAVSRFHAQIHKRDDAYFIRDLGSTHGTYVNNQRNTEELKLKDNDLVRIGTSELIFRIDPNEGFGFEDSSVSEVNQLLVETGSEEAFAALDGRTIAFTLPSDTGVSTKESTGKISEQHSEILSRVADAIKSVFDLDELLGKLMDMLFEIFHPERGVVMLLDEGQEKFVPRVVRPEGESIEFSHTIMNHAIAKRMSLLVSDMADDERFSAAQSIMAQSILAAICCPLVSKDKVLGVLYIDTQSHLLSYQEEDLALLNIIAANAAISIENAMLVQEKLDAERLAAIGLAVAGISHYVKNILTGIHGSSQLIELGISAKKLDVVEKAWPILQRSNDKIHSLVQDMLTYSKKREPFLEDSNLNSLLKEVFENQFDRAVKNGTELILELDEALSDSRFDTKAVYDAVLNIVGNAIEACDDVGDARVVLKTKSHAETNMLSIWITDNGTGIPEEIQKKILEPFFSTKGSKGTGLGLAVSRKTIEEHHGQLFLESEPGKGTTFKIFLPVNPAEIDENIPTQ